MFSFTDIVFFSCVQALKSSDKTKLIFRFSASNNLQAANDPVEFLLIGERVLGLGFFTLLDFRLIANDVTDNLSEFGCVHGNTVVFVSYSVVLITAKDTTVISYSS